MKILACAIGALMILLGLTGIFWPEGLVGVGQYSFTSVGLYVVAIIRVVIGLVLFLAAPASRAPKTLRILGVIVCVAGVAVASLSVQRAQELMDWWTTHGLGFVRVAAVIVVAVGGFIAYVTAPRRQ
jgi:hypothetical protein